MIHAEVPDCEPALRALVNVPVLIWVTIDKQGKVTSSTVNEGPPMAIQCSEAAAKKWLFAPSDRDEARGVRLSFIFTGESKETDEPSHTISSFDDPWTMRLARAVTTIRRLPREDGKIPEKRCPVHGEVMAVEVVGAEYGLLPMRVVDPENPEGSPEEQRREAELAAYVEAREKLFPEANRFVRGGCIVHEPKAEVYYCQSCREAEREWLASHPEFDPNK